MFTNDKFNQQICEHISRTLYLCIVVQKNNHESSLTGLQI
jgi:hypothetical protein